jgi:hypothetical protein
MSPNITHLSILSCQEFALLVNDNLDVQKAHTIIYKDYLAYPDELLAKLKGVDGCIWVQDIS